MTPLTSIVTQSMRRLTLSLLLPQIFLALSVGSTVTVCQAAGSVGIDLHAEEPCHGEHGHDHHSGEEMPLSDLCQSLVENATAPSSWKLPVESPPVDLPPAFSDYKSAISSPLRGLIPGEPPAPPSPPRSVLTGCFLI
ncbi:MAG: hypothetical protein P1U81_10580 [Verrucomicrobiales bacterium]|nr:hypothetical protein [Verrucomicrobiales bacterium]